MTVVDEIRRDRESGAKRLESEYKAGLMAFARRFCVNDFDAEALVYRTFSEVIAGIDGYTEQSAFFGWMCKILVNCHANDIRRRSNQTIVNMGTLPEMEDDGASRVIEAIDAKLLREAVENLPPEMREAVVLRYFMEVPLTQIAKFLSLPVGTVKSRLHYARIALAQRLGTRLKKPAVALIAAGLFLVAGAATVWTMVRPVVTEIERSRLQAADIIEEPLEDTLSDDNVVSDSSEPAHPESDLSPAPSSHTSSSLTSSSAKGKEDMNIRQQAATALAAATLAASSASATTVAWYHFNEGESGETAAGGQPVILNAVDPDLLAGTPYVATGKAAVSASGNNLPAYTNDMPYGVSWYDPVTGARGEDNRSLFLRTNNRKGQYGASTVLIDDNEALHCQNITVEMMIKASPEAAAQYASGDWLHALSMVSDVANNKRAWGIMIRGAGEMFCYMENYKDSTKSINGYNGNPYFYSAWVSGSIPKITDGKWHHVAMTYDGETVRLYVDYTERGSCAYAGPIAYNDDCNGKLSIGPNYANSYGGWDGFIDEVRISDVALPPEKFLRVGGLANNASDQDTAIYLPFNSFETSNDAFFGAIQNENPVLLNSACSTNAGLIDVKLSTITAGILPRLDTGASAVASDTLHAGIFAVDSFANEGCWTYTNNLAYSGKARYITIDDYSKNNNTHLITAGDFTAEFYLKFMGMPTTTTRLLCENSGASGMGTLDFRVASSGLSCTMISQDELDKVESGAASSAKSITLSTSVDDMVDGAWHHVALVVDRARQTVTLYLDRNPVATQASFVLASSVSTKSDSYKTLKIGDGWGGNNAYGFQNMSIDEYRITRRALAPQEFLMTGASVDQTALEPMRTWFRFEGNLGAEPSEGAIPAGSFTAGTVTMAYSPVVPGVRIVDGNGNDIRAANESSMYFSGAHGSGESSPDTANQRLFFARNLLLEKDMKSMTVEFFMKGTKNEAKAWASILRMYGNATGSDSSPYRRLWSVGYKNTNGALYVIKDYKGAAPKAIFYPDDNVSFADGHWHHIAVTFAPDGNGNTLCTFYRDYQQLGSQFTFDGEMECGDYGTSSLAMGSRYNGYLDEVRVSKGVLTVDQMMHVIKRGTMISVR